MTQRYTHEEVRALMATAEMQQQTRKHAETEQVIAELKSGVVPTPERVAHILAWLAGEERAQLIRHHCFWKEHKLRCGFDALVSAALAAHLDLVRCEAALTAYAGSRDPFEDHVDHTVANPAQKEVMAFCAAYAGTVDTLRRVKTARPELVDEIDALRKAATGSAEFRLILDLRTNLSHGSVIVPGWSVSSDLVSASGTMKFSAAELIAFGKWSAESRAFLTGAPGGYIVISAVTNVCVQGLARLRRDLAALFFRNRSKAETDYFDIEDLKRRLSSRQFLKILLQGRVAKGTDPYPHLHQFFPANVVREILRRPPHSAEQVDFIIALRAAETDCDDELRSLLYKLFGVAVQVPIAHESPSFDAA
jgi:hypothetical protein